MKTESPGSGDECPAWGPAFLGMRTKMEADATCPVNEGEVHVLG